MDDAVKKDRWQLFERAILILPTVLIAIVVWLVTSGAERERIRLEYVRVAIAILEPATPTERQKELRRWAVEVLNKSADVKLSSEQSQSLIDGATALPKVGDYGYNDYGYGNGYGTDYGYYFGDPCGPEPSATPPKTP